MKNNLSFALVGQPNCGKTALFNLLTGSNAKIANYPGVTVDRREGYLLVQRKVKIIDLPGTYSLRTTSPDEDISRRVLFGQLGQRPDAIIAVADATNLRMTLRLVLELKQLDLPMVVALNLFDLAKARGIKIDTEKMSKLLGISVIATTAIKKKESAQIQQAILLLANSRLKTSTKNPQTIANDIDHLDSQQLYQEVDRILSVCVSQPHQLPTWHQKLDAIVLHPISGVLILLTILFVMFQAVYAWATPIMDLIENNIANLSQWVATTLPAGMLNDLLVDGVIAGVGSVLVFLPQITLLFALILLLEDSGYLPRAAYLLDNFLAKTGLSGRAFIPLLSSFACAIPSVMSARTIHNPRERLVTIAIAPLLTCSARLPVYALIIAAVIPDQKIWGIFNLQGITLFALYLIGVLSAGMIAFLMKLFASKKGKIQQFPLLMELPTYRLPNLRHILIALWEHMSAFLKRAGTIIFAISIILWALVTFPEAPINATSPAIDYSFAGMLGNLIQPIFAPIGFTWEMCIAMIPGLAAREVVVATLGTVYSVAATSEEMTEHALINLINTNWGLPTAFAFLAWYVYAPMCLATLAVIKRETNSNTKTVLIAGYLTGLAYLIALITYQIALRLVS
ncbi:ferrous iron transporter B [Mergibacter septicus]|uniref:ferrous iron transporter B n=1 Tax=Mergibacter septicus TaxID=221402 RepID=UPI00117926F8|nr:ferrous iron transporter B [Mergibacter septicus]AWX13574.1 ferrous iron transporter B [Mergibacter septicus]